MLRRLGQGLSPDTVTITPGWGTAVDRSAVVLENRRFGGSLEPPSLSRLTRATVSLNYRASPGGHPFHVRRHSNWWKAISRRAGRDPAGRNARGRLGHEVHVRHPVVRGRRRQ